MFRQVGKILSIWINRNFTEMTYGFIAFHYLTDAKKACEQFNNHTLDGFVIKVNLSLKTELKLKNSVRKKRQDWLPKREGILLEFPKLIRTKENILKDILRKNLASNPEIVNDFGKVCCFELENIDYKKPETIKTAPETPTLKTLESTILRYYQTGKDKNTLQVDFDLSKGKVLTTEQYEKFFKTE